MRCLGSLIAPIIPECMFKLFKIMEYNAFYIEPIMLLIRRLNPLLIIKPFWLVKKIVKDLNW